MPTNQDPLTSKLVEIKRLYEEASRERGTEGTLSEIRASKIIRPIHEFVKEELIRLGINPEKIYPAQGQTSPEIKLVGFLKGKNQDVMVIPDSTDEDTEIDDVDVMDVSVSVNIRSQLSSLAKNFDTLYERTFAEALNLHLKSKKLVLGEVYLVPLIAYDPDTRGQAAVRFRETLPVVKYITAFQAINGRNANAVGDEYKYERVCLLIIDFRRDPPVVINDVSQLVAQGMIYAETAATLSMANLTIHDFVNDLLRIYRERHGNLSALQ